MPADAAADSSPSVPELQRRVDELAAELRARTADHDAVAEVLQVINSSPGDLAPVFEAILEKAHRLCETTSGSLHISEGEMFRAVAVRGFTGVFADRLRQPVRPGPNFPVWRLIAGERYVQIANIEQIDDARLRDAAELGGFRTVLFVPLRKEQLFLGYIVASRKDTRLFSDKQIALLENFAAQAVIAMENARLLTEQREALERQTTTAEVLRVINSSPGDLAPVFDAVLKSATRLCDAAFGILWLSDGDHFHAAALHGASEGYAEIARAPHRPLPSNPLGRLLRGERLIVSLDVAAEEPYRAGDPVRRALVDVGGARSVVQVALVKDDVLLGSLTVYRQEVRGFSDKQIALLQNFAAQAVIAIENTRLLTEQKEALDRQTATAEVLQVINSSPGDLAPVFDAMLDKALQLCGAAFGILWTFDGEFVHAAAIRGATTAYAEFLTSTPHRPGVGNAHGRLLRGEEFVHIADVAADTADHSEDPVRQATIELGGARTLLAVALRKGSVVLGFFVIYRREVRPFGEKQISLLQNFAAQAVIAIENARLITETREALEQQTATAEVLRVISQSPTDVQPVLTAVAKATLRFCGAEDAVVHLREDDGLRISAHEGAFNTPVGRLLPLTRDSGVGRSVVDGETCHLPDMLALDPLEWTTARNLAVELGHRASLSAPMLRKGSAVGAILLRKAVAEPFTPRQIALLETFAAQTVIAIENVRLFTELRDRTDELTQSLEYQTATSELLEVISRSTADVQPVLDTMLASAARLCGAAFGAVAVRQGDVFRNVATLAYSPDVDRVVRRIELTPGRQTLVGRTLLAGQLVHISDLAAEPEYTVDAVVQVANLRTAIGVPLMREGEPIGVITLLRDRVDAFTERQIALIKTFADQAAIAMENARLFEELRERQHIDCLLQLVEQLARQAREVIDEVQRVLDLVGDAGGELAERGHLLGLDQVGLRRLQSFQRVAQLGEQAHVFDGDHRLGGESLQELDALVGAAELIVECRRIGNRPNGRSTIGVIESQPQSRNTIPGRVFMTVDFRHPDNDELTKMDAEMRAAAADIARRHRLDVKIEQIWYFPPSPFAKELVESVRRSAEQAGYAHMDIVSGAGHDACYVNRVAPTAMIFVPCKDGISHNEIEDAKKTDIGAGAQILLQAMVERANS